MIFGARVRSDNLTHERTTEEIIAGATLAGGDYDGVSLETYLDMCRGDMATFDGFLPGEAAKIRYFLVDRLDVMCAARAALESTRDALERILVSYDEEELSWVTLAHMRTRRAARSSINAHHQRSSSFDSLHDEYAVVASGSDDHGLEGDSP